MKMIFQGCSTIIVLGYQMLCVAVSEAHETNSNVTVVASLANTTIDKLGQPPSDERNNNHGAVVQFTGSDHTAEHHILVNGFTAYRKRSTTVKRKVIPRVNTESTMDWQYDIVGSVVAQVIQRNGFRCHSVLISNERHTPLFSSIIR